MKESISIKRHHIGSGRPVVCVPIVETEAEAVLQMAKKLHSNRVEMIEWRIDWFDGYQDMEQTLTVLKKLGSLLEHSILLCTYRSKAQGGEGLLTGEAYKNLLFQIAKSQMADIIDVEFFMLDDAKKTIEELKNANICVLASDHDFHKTPTIENMKEKLIGMYEAGADIEKLAVMPKDEEDVLNLLSATLYMKKNIPGSRVVTMAMDSTGVITRLSGEIFGSCVTFASFQKSSAPGQMEISDVTLILDKIHENYSK